jgi:hypothetical protein
VLKQAKRTATGYKPGDNIFFPQKTKYIYSHLERFKHT